LGLYERLLEDREEEELRRVTPLGKFYGSESAALDRLLANAPENRPKKYGADLRKLHMYIRKGVHSPGAGRASVSRASLH
jgi:hypothetical protein